MLDGESAPSPGPVPAQDALHFFPSYFVCQSFHSRAAASERALVMLIPVGVLFSTPSSQLGAALLETSALDLSSACS